MTTIYYIDREANIYEVEKEFQNPGEPVKVILKGKGEYLRRELNGKFKNTLAEAEAYAASRANHNIAVQAEAEADAERWYTVLQTRTTEPLILGDICQVEEVDGQLIFTESKKKFTLAEAESGKIKITNTRLLVGVCQRKNFKEYARSLRAGHTGGTFLERCGGKLTGEMRLPKSKKSIKEGRVEVQWSHLVSQRRVYETYYGPIDKTGVGDYVTGSDFYESKSKKINRMSKKWVMLSVGELPNSLQDEAVNLLEGAQ